VLFGYSAQSLVYFSPEFLQLVQVVATQVGSAVKNAQLYEELRLLSLDLDRKVRERTAELERANEQLREVDRLKSEFLSVVAHEFRTPLTSICSFAEILLHYDTLDATQRRRFVEIINEEGQRLTRLISQVLDISRIESGKLELRLEYHDLRAIVAAAFQIAEPVAGRRGIRLCFDAPAALPPVYVDRDRVLQVITNLLSNAVQLSPPGETVRVAALPAGRPRYMMGIGAPEDLLDGVARGVDLFDCVLPTRLGRNGAVFTHAGKLNLRNAGLATRSGPIEDGCDCEACAEFSLGYLHHLFRCEELLGYRLASIHNLRFLVRLMAEAREAILAGSYDGFHEEFRSRYRPPDEQVRNEQRKRWREARSRWAAGAGTELQPAGESSERAAAEANEERMDGARPTGD